MMSAESECAAPSDHVEMDRTLYVSNLSDSVSEKLLYELFLQAGPLEKVHLKKKDGSTRPSSFAFVTFQHTESVPYSIALMGGVRLFGRSLDIKPRQGSAHIAQLRRARSDLMLMRQDPHLQSRMGRLANGMHGSMTPPPNMHTPPPGWGDRSYSNPNFMNQNASSPMMAPSPLMMQRLPLPPQQRMRPPMSNPYHRPPINQLDPPSQHQIHRDERQTSWYDERRRRDGYQGGRGTDGRSQGYRERSERSRTDRDNRQRPNRWGSDKRDDRSRSRHN